MLDPDVQRKQIEKFINRMPSLSTTVGKVMEICSRVDASPNELNKVISLDPVLTGQVLKLINSAYYSLVNKVTSLTRAITMLGLNTVKNMALSTAIIKTVSGAKKIKGASDHQVLGSFDRCGCERQASGAGERCADHGKRRVFYFRSSA